MNQAQVVEWLVGICEHEGFVLDEVWQVYLSAREEKRRETGSLKYLVIKDYEIYEKLMQQRTDYAVGKVREYIEQRRK